MKKLLFLSLILVNCMAVAQSPRVVVIGIDGLSISGVKTAKTPVLDSLMKTGSFSLKAKAVYPSSSSPNWASMIMGASPAQHGIWSNDWKRSDIADTVLCGGEKGQLFPTIFRLVREKLPSSKIATFYDWDDFGRLLEDDVCNAKEDGKGEIETTLKAAAYFTAETPDFMFVHLDHVDHAGHELGHASSEYFESVSKADSLIGIILQSIRNKNLQNETTVIVTADHGGNGKSHGGQTVQEMTIPWIISGPEIKKGHEIKMAIDTYDTAVTVARVFGLTPYDCWTGRPIEEAFSK